MIKSESDAGHYSVRKLCLVLEISRASYYRWLQNKPSKRVEQYKFLDNKITSLFLNYNKIYGAAKIHQLLRRCGVSVCYRTVQRHMQSLGLQSATVTKWKATPSSNLTVINRKNIFNQDFSANKINQKWAMDITYIKTINDGWCYLASIIDLFSKKIISSKFSKVMDTNLVISTLIEATKNYKGVILHSDLGSQFTSDEFESILKKLSILFLEKDVHMIMLQWNHFTLI